MVEILNPQVKDKRDVPTSLLLVTVVCIQGYYQHYILAGLHSSLHPDNCQQKANMKVRTLFHSSGLLR